MHKKNYYLKCNFYVSLCVNQCCFSVHSGAARHSHGANARVDKISVRTLCYYTWGELILLYLTVLTVDCWFSDGFLLKILIAFVQQDIVTRSPHEGFVRPRARNRSTTANCRRKYQQLPRHAITGFLSITYRFSTYFIYSNELLLIAVVWLNG